MKLRGGALLPKFLNTENEKLQNIITVLRSLEILIMQHDHDKCKLSTQNTKDNLCQFCLIDLLLYEVTR